MARLAGLILIINLAIVGASLSGDEWQSFKKTYGKIYKDDNEDMQRKQVYFLNKEKVEQHNQLYSEGKSSFTMKVNQYSDMTYEEFSTTVLMEPRTLSPLAKGSHVYENANVNADPDTVDWTTGGCVAPVKDQGSCGSCYAFSAAAGLESQTCLKTSNLINLSAQNIMDCSTSYGNNGCNGGYIEAGFQYVIDNGGIDTEEAYPYLGFESKCDYSANGSGATCNAYVDISRGDEKALATAVANIGPISGCFYASPSFQQYSSGVFKGEDCDSSSTNHCILIVGYGNDGSDDFWKVKNSWGTGWGEDGFFRIVRNDDNKCLIASDAHYPIV